MKNKFYRLLTFLPLLLVLSFTNIYQDPANIFHDESDKQAEAILNGYAVYNTIGNRNERAVKKNIILGMAKQIDCIALGSSLIMCVNQDLVGTTSFYNLGVSGGDYYDVIGQLGLMDIAGKKVQSVIINVDSILFNEALYDSKHNLLMPYANYYIEKMNGLDVTLTPQVSEDNLLKKINQIFSVSYFQASIEQVQKNNSFKIKQDRWGIVEDQNTTKWSFYDIDGSWHYPKSYQSNKLDYIQTDIANYDMAQYLSKDRHLSNDEKQRFEKLIKYLNEQNIKIKLFLCPLSLGLWDRMQAESEDYTYIMEIEEYIKEISQKYPIKLIGSYNPYFVGISNSDFYDARHVRREALSKYFQFKDT